MQFQLLVEKALKADEEYQKLRNTLLEQQQRCLKKATSRQQSQQCMNASQHFETYLNEYTYQYREKGRKICSQSVRREGPLADKVQVKNECLQFYHKSVGIFQDNVKDKLKSLVFKIDFSQL